MKFDLTKIQLSNNDVKKGLTLPTKMSCELAELIGILAGDGYLYSKNNHYLVGVVGSPKNDLEYFYKIQKIILKLFNLKSSINVRGRGLYLTLTSKGVFQFLTLAVGFPYGKGKGEKITLSQYILTDEKFINSALRGVFDTDGSIFTSYKKGAPNYPCIELSTTSINLAKQTKTLLEKQGFRVANIRAYQPGNYLISYKVSLYGNKNILLWYDKIGFSNPIKQDKLIKIKMRAEEFESSTTTSSA